MYKMNVFETRTIHRQATMRGKMIRDIKKGWPDYPGQPINYQ